MKGNKLKNYFIIGYILFLILGALYVDSILKHTPIKEKGKQDQIVEEIKPVTVYLNVENDKTYKVDLKNQDSVSDLLDKLRDNGDIFFEKTRYTYGIEIEELGHVKTPEGYNWRIFLNDLDITPQLDKLKLVDQNTYILKLVKE